MAESAVHCVIQSLRKLKSSDAKFSHGIREQLEIIDLKLRRLQGISRIADARQHEDDTIHDWVARTREIAYDAEDLLDIFASEISSRHERSILRRPSEKRFRTLHDIESKISSQVTDWLICNIGCSNHGDSQRHQQLRTYSCHREEEFVGLEEDFEEVVSKLVHENVNNCYHVVSIIGIDGIGKTALARKVYNHGNIRSHFHAFAWAIISREWQAEEVLQRILCKLVPEKRELIDRLTDIAELLKELFEIQKTKKCLVVLDDVCGTDVWNSLRPAFLNPKSCSKILLTTCNKEIAEHIDTDTTCYFYEQRRLNEKESIELLQKKASRLINIAVENEYASGFEEDSTSSRGSFHSCRSLEEEDEFLDNLAPDSEGDVEDPEADEEKFVKEMVEQCGGLPLAINLLGNILMQKSTLDEWEAVHRSFISHLSERGLVENVKVYEMLALSYYNLPYQIKQCFWHLGNFPNYYSVPTRKLYQLWAAEGFLLSDKREGEVEESIMDIGNRHLCELEKRCMVQVHVEESTGRLNSCQLHEFIREICIVKGVEENFQRTPLLHESDLNDISFASSTSASTRSSSSRTPTSPVSSYIEMNITSGRDDLEHVRSALLLARPGERENLQAKLKLLCDSYKLLRILDLERFDLGEDLCEAIGNLVHLRFLSFRGSRFNKLPSSIGNLKFLQTLDLRVAFSSNLIIPDVLGKLNQLRHLYLPPSQSITNRLQLSSLKELEILKNFDPRVSDFRDISKLNKLQKLTIIYCFEIENLKAIHKYLRINSSHLSDSSFRIHYNFRSAKEFTLLEQLVGCVHLRKLDLVGQIEKLPEHNYFSQRLTKLILRNSTLKEDPLAILEKLPNLYSLSLRKQAYVGRRICCSARGFCQLRAIELQGLASLEDWIIEKGSMPNLLHMTIEECVKLEMLPEGIKFLYTIRELMISKMPEAFTQTVESLQEGNGNKSYNVVIVRPGQNSSTEFERQQGIDHHKLGLLRTFSPVIVPKTWQSS